MPTITIISHRKRWRLAIKKILILFILLLAGYDALASEKWIVVTTIQYPTAALQQLNSYASQNGWELVVVGDKKTPEDWSCENCKYLGVHEQEQLGYEIIQHLPWNHYCRKNIGYLYAIEHGAKLIYETDDDNYPIASLEPIPKDYLLNKITGQDSVINIFAYFGQPDVWPRGFPLEKIRDEAGIHTQPSQRHNIGIEHGLINKEPDVDAIFRLTRAKEVHFDQCPPCILKKGVFAPFNTQNTLFHHEAFWGLYIPATTPFRVCDIWRGYFTQRLLWDINYLLCFKSPTAIQERNEHDYLVDFKDELELYLKAGNLTKNLLEWQSDQSEKFENRILSLYKYLVKLGHIKELDYILIQAWINDLKKVGYVFPAATSP